MKVSPDLTRRCQETKDAGTRRVGDLAGVKMGIAREQRANY